MPSLLRNDQEIAKSIRCIISDVDGVLTDGTLIYDANGCESKHFHVHDGVAIKAWMKTGFRFAILTARNSSMVADRALELGIDAVRQGFQSKWPAAQELLAEFGYEPSEACYIGDDLPDIAVMNRVGLAAAPADAGSDARFAAHWVMRQPGGRGAVRELVERLLRAKNRWEEHVPN